MPAAPPRRRSDARCPRRRGPARARAMQPDMRRPRMSAPRHSPRDHASADDRLPPSRRPTRGRAREVFGIDTDLVVPAFAEVDEHVPEVDAVYRFDRRRHARDPGRLRARPPRHGAGPARHRQVDAHRAGRRAPQLAVRARQPRRPHQPARPGRQGRRGAGGGPAGHRVPGRHRAVGAAAAGRAGLRRIRRRPARRDVRDPARARARRQVHADGPEPRARAASRTSASSRPPTRSASATSTASTTARSASTTRRSTAGTSSPRSTTCRPPRKPRSCWRACPRLACEAGRDERWSSDGRGRRPDPQGLRGRRPVDADVAAHGDHLGREHRDLRGPGARLPAVVRQQVRRGRAADRRRVLPALLRPRAGRVVPLVTTADHRTCPPSPRRRRPRRQRGAPAAAGRGALRGVDPRARRRGRSALPRPPAAPRRPAAAARRAAPASRPERDDFASFPGAADGLALRLAHSDAGLHRRLAAGRRQSSALVFDLLEQFRVESLAPATHARRAPQPAPSPRGLVAGLPRAGLTDTARGLLLFTVAQVCRARVTGEPVVEETEDLLEATRAGLVPTLGGARAAAAASQRPGRVRGTRARDSRAGRPMWREAGRSRTRRRPPARTGSACSSTRADSPDPATAASVPAGSSEAADGYRIFTRRTTASKPAVRAARLEDHRDRLDERVAADGVNVAKLARSCARCSRYRATTAAAPARRKAGSTVAGLPAGGVADRAAAVLRSDRFAPVADCA